MQGFITDVTRQAAEVLLRYFRSGTLQSDPKGAWDLVTEADRASEALIIGMVRDRFPAHAVFGEESGRSGDGHALWLIDPLDGTVNFSRGLPIWGVSVALAEDGDVRYGAFYDPLANELFYAERDAGAWLNGEPLRTSGMSDLAGAIVCCATAHGDGEDVARRNTERLWGRVMRLRMLGSIGAALAAVAAGRADVAIEVRGGPWDYGAGGLLVREAGGQATSFDGQPFTSSTRTILAAATDELHRAVRDVVEN